MSFTASVVASQGESANCDIECSTAPLFEPVESAINPLPPGAAHAPKRKQKDIMAESDQFDSDFEDTCDEGEHAGSYLKSQKIIDLTFEDPILTNSVNNIINDPNLDVGEKTSSILRHVRTLIANKLTN